jgi:hypothetical protein
MAWTQPIMSEQTATRCPARIRQELAGSRCGMLAGMMTPSKLRLALAPSLIEAVYERTREAGASRVYWLTHETNDAARSLYDKLADYPGFVQYRNLF